MPSQKPTKGVPAAEDGAPASASRSKDARPSNGHIAPPAGSAATTTSPSNVATHRVDDAAAKRRAADRAERQRRRMARPSLVRMVQASIEDIELKAEKSTTSLVRRWTCRNVTFFVLLYSVILCIRAAMEAYITGMLEFIQQQYNFSAGQLSLISGVQQFGLVTSLSVVALAGRLSHRPLMMFCGVLVVVLGAFIWSSPYFVTATTRASNNVISSINLLPTYSTGQYTTLIPPQPGQTAPVFQQQVLYSVSDPSSQSTVVQLPTNNGSSGIPLYYSQELCGAQRNTSTVSSSSTSTQQGSPCSYPVSTETVSTAFMAYSLLCFGGFLMGLGTGLFITAGFMYIEESGQEKNSALYYGVLFSMYGLGQFLGACVSWWFSSYSVDLQITEKEDLKMWTPRAWWLGMVFLAIVLFIVSWAFLLFPNWITEPGWVASRRQRRLRHLSRVLEWAKEKRHRKRERKKRAKQKERRQRAEQNGVEGGGALSMFDPASSSSPPAGDSRRLDTRRESNFSTGSSLSTDTVTTPYVNHNHSEGLNLAKGHDRRISNSTVCTTVPATPLASRQSSVVEGIYQNGTSALDSSGYTSGVSNGSGSANGSANGHLAGPSVTNDNDSDDSFSDADPASSSVDNTHVYLNSNSNSNILSSIQEEPNSGELNELSMGGGFMRGSETESNSHRVSSEQYPDGSRGNRGVRFNEIGSNVADDLEDGGREEDDMSRASRLADPRRKNKTKLQAAFDDLFTIICNLTYLISVISAALAAYLPAGYRSTLSHYAQAEFEQEYQYAWFYTDGLCYSIAQTIGPVIGAVIIHKAKLSQQQRVLMIICLLVINIVLFLLIFPIGCTDGGLPWQNNSYSADIINNPPASSCYGNCLCSAEGVMNTAGVSASAIQLEPVCSSEGIRFFSPCHAGCTQLRIFNSTIMYSGCSCASSEVSNYYCSLRCKAYGGFWVVLFLAVTAHSIGQVCIILLFLREVAEELRNLSLGFAVWIVVVSAYVPGAAVFRGIKESACSISQTDCHSEQTCWKYDLDKYRYVTHGANVAFQTAAAIGFTLILFLLKRRATADPPLIDNVTSPSSNSRSNNVPLQVRVASSSLIAAVNNVIATDDDDGYPPVSPGQSNKGFQAEEPHTVMTLSEADFIHNPTNELIEGDTQNGWLAADLDYLADSPDSSA